MDMTPEQIELLQQQLVELQNKMGSQVRPGDKVNLSRGAYKRTPTPEEVKERLAAVGINDISEITKPIDDYRAQLEAMLPQLEAAAKPDPVGSVGRALSVWMANQPRELGYADMRELYPAKDTDAANKRIEDHKAKIAALQEKNIDNRLNVAKLAKDFAIEVPSMTASVSEAIPPSPSSQWDPRIPKPRPLSASAISDIGDKVRAARMVPELLQVIDSNRDLFDPVKGAMFEVGTDTDTSTLGKVLAGVRSKLEPEDDQRARGVLQKLVLFRQLAGKPIEGGVLRKEDDTKWKTIIGSLAQYPDVAKEAVQYLGQGLVLDTRDFLKRAQSSGYYIGPEGEAAMAELDAMSANIDRQAVIRGLQSTLSKFEASRGGAVRQGRMVPTPQPNTSPAPGSKPGFKSIKDWKSQKGK